jgi:hypothetical protein
MAGSCRQDAADSAGGAGGKAAGLSPAQRWRSPALIGPLRFRQAGPSWRAGAFIRENGNG